MISKDKSKDRIELANRIRQLRLDCEKTQEQFAEILGISVSALKKIESGENQISVEGLRRLEKKLHVSADYIIFGKKTNPNMLWTDILNCTEDDKFYIMMRLIYYFTNIKNSTFCDSNTQKQYDKKILDFMKLQDTNDSNKE